jgi:hypothetical protein
MVTSQSWKRIGCSSLISPSTGISVLTWLLQTHVLEVVYPADLQILGGEMDWA